MPMDGLTLGFAAREIDKAIAGGRIDKVNQPEKDALVLVIRAGQSNYRLLLSASPVNARAQLTSQTFVNPVEPPVFCMLMRKKLLGARILSVAQMMGDRVLRVQLESMDDMNELVRLTLVLEVMGRYSNLILVNEDGRIIDAIRRVGQEMSRVRELLPGVHYQSPPAQDKCDPLAFEADDLALRLYQAGGRLDKALMASLMGFSPASARELCFRLTGAADTPISEVNTAVLAARAKELLSAFPALTPPVILTDADGEIKDLFPFQYFSCPAALQKECATIGDAMDEFFARKDLNERMGQKSATLTRTVKTNIDRCEKKLALQQEAIDNSARMEEYRICGELLTANLHALKKGMENARVVNYYDSECPEMLIPMDLQLTPVQNAQRYYKKYQKARSAKEEAALQKEKTLNELLILESALDDLPKCTTESDLQEVREVLVAAGFVKPQSRKGAKRKLPQSQPYRYLSRDGIEIHVGKSSLQNERLTGDARGGEMWLHVKDRPGSHVIIRTESDVPEGTLMEAAQLAAYYSSVRASANIPVDYTLRKNVKKPGGTPAGFVTYKGQRTLFITVSDKDIRQIKELSE